MARKLRAASFITRLRFSLETVGSDEHPENDPSVGTAAGPAEGGGDHVE
jgi:hypothetical protein